jgi:hypothetical protein
VSTHATPGQGAPERLEALPPFDALERVAARLRDHGFEFALGASALLHAHGLVARVGDWDLTTDAPLDEVRRAFDEVPHEFCGNSGIHTDHKLRLEGGDVELIVRMSLAVESGDVHIPTIVQGTWRGMPLGSLEAWAVAYSIMGRPERTETAFAALLSRGADPSAIGRLRTQPLPPELDERLAELPVRREPPCP